MGRPETLTRQLAGDVCADRLGTALTLAALPRHFDVRCWHGKHWYVRQRAAAGAPVLMVGQGVEDGQEGQGIVALPRALVDVRATSHAAGLRVLWAVPLSTQTMRTDVEPDAIQSILVQTRATSTDNRQHSSRSGRGQPIALRRIEEFEAAACIDRIDRSDPPSSSWQEARQAVASARFGAREEGRHEWWAIQDELGLACVCCIARRGKDAFMFGLHTRADRRRRGLAGTLIAHLVDLARTRWTCAHIVVAAELHSDAEAWYQRLGFEVVERQVLTHARIEASSDIGMVTVLAA